MSAGPYKIQQNQGPPKAWSIHILIAIFVFAATAALILPVVICKHKLKRDISALVEGGIMLLFMKQKIIADSYLGAVFLQRPNEARVFGEYVLLLGHVLQLWPLKLWSSGVCHHHPRGSHTTCPGVVIWVCSVASCFQTSWIFVFHRWILSLCLKKSKVHRLCPKVGVGDRLQVPGWSRIILAMVQLLKNDSVGPPLWLDRLLGSASHQVKH